MVREVARALAMASPRAGVVARPWGRVEARAMVARRVDPGRVTAGPPAPAVPGDIPWVPVAEVRVRAATISWNA